MDLNNFRIAYFPNTPDCNFPGDRRRFVFYAKARNIKFDIASVKEKYDIVYLTMGCNIAEWLAYKKKYPQVKLIFEIVDSYFLEDLNLYTAVRGLVRFIAGKESTLYLYYKNALKKMLRVADAVVCSTAIQKEHIIPYNKNVHISLDYFLNDITHFKTDLSSKEKLKLVWEGQSYTVNNVLSINEQLKNVSGKVELHIITDPEIKYPFKIFNKKTIKLLSVLECDYQIHQWEKNSFSKIIADMDLAIIPLGNSKHKVLTINKPENKLLLFWQIGIQVITDCSPAYKKVMDKAGLDMYCKQKNEWSQKIERYIETSVAERVLMKQKTDTYLELNHSREIILRKWDDIFASLYVKE